MGVQKLKTVDAVNVEVETKPTITFHLYHSRPLPSISIIPLLISITSFIDGFVICDGVTIEQSQFLFITEGGDEGGDVDDGGLQRASSSSAANQNIYGNTVLHEAAISGNLEAVNILVSIRSYSKIRMNSKKHLCLELLLSGK
ncbi:hypothetical protein Ddye_013115 [Dipteronia dyeriana]|uniref:Ankyrin repeat protein n=1 Tax=Dipteronia dyeriana TaxID=168575 RepID=A0AAE0CJB6_9ROSI|nr:hypothetical protein Ddye_013115 [Dipteronia dyeriana]